MKLLLLSSGNIITKLLPQMIDKPIKELKIGWITTASKGVDDLSYLERHKKNMTDLGWNFEEIDIEGKSQEELRELLKKKDAIHIEGGNTFYLLKAIKETKFDKVLKEFIKQGKIYIGSSAGAYIMCPTIEMSTWKLPIKDRHGLQDLTALNYIPFLIFVHYIPKYKEWLKEKISQSKYPVKILKNGQALLVEDDRVELIGEGEEVDLSE